MLGSSCGTVDHVVSFNTRGPWFKSNRPRLLLNNYYCQPFVERTKIKKKDFWNVPFKNDLKLELQDDV